MSTGIKAAGISMVRQAIDYCVGSLHRIERGGRENNAWLSATIDSLQSVEDDIEGLAPVYGLLLRRKM